MKDIIIDTCTLSSVFVPENIDHIQFEDVYKAIKMGRCRIVYGGTKYIDELSKVRSIIPLILALSKQNKVRVLDSKEVDKKQRRVESIVANPKFNDPHLPAIALVGNCHLICTKDKECMEYIKDKRLYPTHFKVPAFYSSKRNRQLLYD